MRELLEAQRSPNFPSEKLGSSSLVSSIFQREGNLHCSLTLYRASMRAML